MSTNLTVVSHVTESIHRISHIKHTVLIIIPSDLHALLARDSALCPYKHFENCSLMPKFLA